jgi:hypothetical protein
LAKRKICNINISECKSISSTIPNLISIPTIKILNISACNFNLSAVKLFGIQKNKNNKNIEELDVSRSNLRLNDFIEMSNYFLGLKKLTFSRNTLNQDDDKRNTAMIEMYNFMNTITHLEAVQSSLSYECFMFICKFTSLTTLDISMNGSIMQNKEKSINFDLGGLKYKLKVLIARFCDLNYDFFIAICQCTCLETLDLTGNSFIFQEMPRNYKLNFGSMKTTLKTLKIRHCHLNFEILEAICEIEALEILEIEEVDIRPESMIHEFDFGKLKNLKKLKKVMIRLHTYNSDIREKIKKTLPKCCLETEDFETFKSSTTEIDFLESAKF